jgi:hypothetical protein
MHSPGLCSEEMINQRALRLHFGGCLSLVCVTDNRFDWNGMVALLKSVSEVSDGEKGQIREKNQDSLKSL